MSFANFLVCGAGLDVVCALCAKIMMLVINNDLTFRASMTKLESFTYVLPKFLLKMSVLLKITSVEPS